MIVVNCCCEGDRDRRLSQCVHLVSMLRHVSHAHAQHQGQRQPREPTHAQMAMDDFLVLCVWARGVAFPYVAAFANNRGPSQHANDSSACRDSSVMSHSSRSYDILTSAAQLLGGPLGVAVLGPCEAHKCRQQSALLAASFLRTQNPHGRRSCGLPKPPTSPRGARR